MTKTTTTTTVFEYDKEGRIAKETKTVTETDVQANPWKPPLFHEVKDFEVWNLNKPHTYIGSLSEGGYL
jgi:hypothetical protein